MKKVLSATVGLIALSAMPAIAADLPVKARPMVPVAMAYNWTGCHIGGNVGGKWVRTSGSVDIAATTPGALPGTLGAGSSVLYGSENSSTLIAGGQVGCDYQAAGTNWVFGIEADFDWQRWSRTTTLAGTVPFIFVPGDFFDVRSDWQSSLRGRVGYAFDRLLIYATGGGAFTNLKVGTNFIAIGAFPAAFAQDSKTIAGWTFGGGFEYAFVNNFSFGIEGRYSWYGNRTFNGGLVSTIFTPVIGGPGALTFAPVTQSVKLETFEVMAKLNWKIF